MRQQLSQSAVRPGGEFGEDVFQIGPGIVAVELGGFDQAHEDGGAFAGLFAIDAHRLLAASTDSVGSKLVLGRRAGKLRWCGADLAAHCINDVATCGAEPLMLLDYVAANAIELDEVVELVEGAAARVYAGNGIVAGSNPEKEFAETEWKFKAMLGALCA